MVRVQTGADLGAGRHLFVGDASSQGGEAAGTTDSAAVVKNMKGTPINDMFAKNGKIREDGRMIHDMYLFEVNRPSESKGRWDDCKPLATVPGNEAFQSLDASRCPLVKK